MSTTDTTTNGLMTPLAAPKREVAELVVLCGRAAPTPLESATGRSSLTLPVTEQEAGRPIDGVDLWLRGERLVRDRIVFAGDATVLGDRPAGKALAMNDLAEHRGTAGVLKDVVDASGDPERWILVAEGLRVVPPDWADRSDWLLQGHPDSDGLLARGADGQFLGLMLIRARCLEEVPDVGYVDLKEQALPRIAQRADLRVVTAPPGWQSHPVRSLDGYTAAIDDLAVKECEPEGDLTRIGDAGSPSSPEGAGSGRGWRGRVVEPGGLVDQSSGLYASSVLRGGQVGARCLLVRCVVCSGARVPDGTRAARRIFEG
jgi:hypothetical protein